MTTVKVEMVTEIKPIKVQAPVAPTNKHKKKRESVRYIELSKEELDDIKNQVGAAGLCVYFCKEWADGQGSDMTNDETVDFDRVIITDRDVLSICGGGNSIKYIDEDEIFSAFYMIDDQNLISDNMHSRKYGGFINE